MGTSAGTDPGKIMGRLWANAPGPRVSAAQAATLGGQVPAGARIDRTANTITFTATTVRLTVLASPSGGPDETFCIAGVTNPAIVVRGSQVSIGVINADPDTAHGLVVTASQDTTWMPMMTARPAFTGSALWFLGNPTSAGMHAGTLTFTAATPGTYQYLCPAPGHARTEWPGSSPSGEPEANAEYGTVRSGSLPVAPAREADPYLPGAEQQLVRLLRRYTTRSSNPKGGRVAGFRPAGSCRWQLQHPGRTAGRPPGQETAARRGARRATRSAS